VRIALIVASLLVFTCPSAGSSLIPVVANPGFEQVQPGNDAPGWAWMCSAQASFHSETQDPHSGSRCVALTNGSSLAPNVYGRLYQGVGVLPHTKYELTVWVRGEDIAEGSHFTDWSAFTLNIPGGAYGWRKISTVFTTADSQYSLNLGINLTNKIKQIAIDDISLRPVGTEFKGTGVAGSFFVPGQVTGDNKPASVLISLTSSKTAKVEATIKSGKTELFRKSEQVNPGDSAVEWQWNTGATAKKDLVFAVRVLDEQGNELARGSQQIQKLSLSILKPEIDRVESRLKGEFMSLYEKCRAKGIALDFPRTTRTLLEQFIPLTRQDSANGEERRASYAIIDMNRSLDESIARMKAYLANPNLVPNVRRYRTGKVTIQGLSLVGPWVDDKGNSGHGPLFFCGYGHFSQVRKDMSRWPGYGINIIQSAEFGPSAILKSENEISLEAARTAIETLDNAAVSNVRVDFLLSPHYFPGWALKKWPNIAKGGGGWIGYSMDEPEAKYVVEKFLRILVPMLKDKPALNSFCLTNEPNFDRAAECANTRGLWTDFLIRIYGDITSLNSTCGTAYATFADVPVPGNNSYNDPQFYDWVDFTDERFAAWHQWMADVIHELAPDVPVHAKAMWIPLTWRHAIAWGTDPERFSKFSDLSGNDCEIHPGSGDWGISWYLQNSWLDLQRSVGGKPIFDSEYHLQSDGSSAYIPPEHYRTALWQAAIHGQSASTMWVWERSMPDKSWSHPFYGNVMDRPGCAQAVGTTCMDLNRFADEVTALKNAAAPVAILYSRVATAKSDNYLDAVNRAYTALNFCGVKIDFITEKQLARGEGAQYRMVVLPAAENVLDSTVEAIETLPVSTRIVILGDSLHKDPYGRVRPAGKLASVQKRAIMFPVNADPQKDLWPIMLHELGKAKALPDISVVGAETGKPVWGVEWLPARMGGGTIINVVNLLSKPVDIRIIEGNKKIEARNLLSLGGRAQVGHLKPITPVLIRVGNYPRHQGSETY